jgi:hypothetical protein
MYQHFPFYVSHSKIYPTWDFWFENKPSGNPAAKAPFFWTLLEILTMATGIFNFEAFPSSPFEGRRPRTDVMILKYFRRKS